MKVLIAEDNSTSALLLRRTLGNMGHETVIATDGLAAWELIQQGDIRLVITDWMMPRMDGLELCRRIRKEIPHQDYTYVIMLTAKHHQKDRVKALQAGADDLLSKPFDPCELMARTQVAQRILGMQEELRARSRELELMGDELKYRNELLTEMADCDSLTGLKNRRHFREVFDLNFSFSARQRLPLSLVVLDVDEFKAYNDTFGHPAGDTILSGLASLLSSNSREHDLVARYGGEEFVVLLPATEEDTARVVCERTRGMIECHDWPLRPITISFGISTMGPDTLSPTQLIDEADRALYHSKRRGRNRVTHFHDLAAVVRNK